MDLAPLAKLMWSAATANCEFRFIESEPRDLAPIEQTPVLFPRFEVDLDMLNHFLKWLRKDTKKVKLFAQQMTSLLTYTSCLRYERDDALSRVQMQYRCSDGPQTIDFALDYADDWKDIFTEAPYRPSLYGIPETLRWQIYQEVL
jgi:hypothetical protein